MFRALQIAGLWSLAAGVCYCDQKKDPPPPRPAASRPNPPKNAGAAKNLGPRMINPASPAARLFQASPEERERAIEKFPAPRQQAIRKNLEWFDHLPKPQQEMVVKRAERLASLPPDKQRAVQQQLRAWQQLPPDRRQAVQLALRRLQPLSDQERLNILSSEPFQKRFSPEEQKIISDLSEIMPPPM